MGFHTDCSTAAESQGIAICFTQNLEELIRNDFQDGPNTRKYWRLLPDYQGVSNPDREQASLVHRLTQIPERLPLYDFLKTAIPHWHCFLELSLLLKSRENPPLDVVLEVIPSEDVAQTIHTMPPNSEVSAALFQGTPRRSPIREALKDYLPEGASKPSFFQRLFRKRP